MVQNSYWGTTCSATALLQALHMPAASFQIEYVFFDLVQAVLEGRISWNREGGKKKLCYPQNKVICTGHLFCKPFVFWSRYLPWWADSKMHDWLWIFCNLFYGNREYLGDQLLFIKGWMMLIFNGGVSVLAFPALAWHIVLLCEQAGWVTGHARTRLHKGLTQMNWVMKLMFHLPFK